MITRFDHCVIGVPDLDQAVATFERLGFDVRRGGRHTGRGTHNALIRFGLDYLELLAIHDEAEARQSDGSGVALIEFLRDRGAGLLGFALASGNLDDEYARGYAADAPFGMQRVRPDGRMLAWRLLVPGAHTWGRPWPFLIEWHTPDEERLQWDDVGSHPNGATGVDGLIVGARDLDAVKQLYRHKLELEPRDNRIILPDSRTIDLVENDVEGPIELRLRTRDGTELVLKGDHFDDA